MTEGKRSARGIARRAFLKGAAALATVEAVSPSRPTMASADTGPLEVWVAPGSKSGDGTKARPFTSLLAARDGLRRLRASRPGRAAIVHVEGGEYSVPAEGLMLTAADGGSSPEAPVIWRGLRGDRNHAPRISGGANLSGKAFRPITESHDPDAWATIPAEVRDKVLVADLAALGIHDYGSPPVLYRGDAPLLELFFNGTPLPLARYPNTGWAETAQVIDSGSRPRFDDTTNRPGVFTCAVEPDRLRRWAAAPDTYLYGYFCHDWYDEVVRAGRIDPNARTIATAVPVFYGIGWPDGAPRNQPSPPRRFIVQNVLCELDSPGEWYLDRKTGRLYLYPPEPIQASSEIVVSIAEKPLLATDSASHLRIEDFALAYTRGDTIRVSGGENVALARCELDDIGGTGILIEEGRGHRVANCRLTRMGQEGIVLRGGDRKTLVPAGHVAEGNQVSFFGRRQRTYAVAIHLEGVGNSAIGNSLHDAPHSAIFLGGNDHRIEYNEIYRVCQETDDCGAFYMGRDVSARGNLLRWNYFHHIGGDFGPHSVGNTAVYFDDGASGNTVEGCLFYKCGNPGHAKMGAIFIHGGQRNRIVNCLFLQCQRVVGKNPWKDERWAKFVTDEQPVTKWKPAGIDPSAPPYTTHYPELKELARTDVSRRDSVERCLSIGCDAFVAPERIGGTGFDVSGNVEFPGSDAPPLLADARLGTLDPGAVVTAEKKCPGFEPIPIARIGLAKF